MSLRYAKSLTALFSLLIFLLSGQPGVQAYVLCVAESGHTELELAQGISCGPEEKSQQSPARSSGQPTAALPSAEEDHCGPCLDIPASTETTSLRQQKQPHASTVASVPPMAADVSALVVASREPLRPTVRPPPRISPVILQQRTVVLLT
ncbi:MAG: hypothetical protein RQ723_09340 [Desulfuromonadales bacterium]|nr:hypothetical protein [Desulfuromonadales bacterium]